MTDADFRSLLKRGPDRSPKPDDFGLGPSQRGFGYDLDAAPARRQTPTPLDDIAALVQTLTYGEMIELSEALWKSRSEGAVTGETLPPLLHRWSASHLAAA
jgi:hypothetical protein